MNSLKSSILLICIVLILTGFLNLITPQSSLKHTIKTIFGLFILLCIITSFSNIKLSNLDIINNFDTEMVVNQDLYNYTSDYVIKSYTKYYENEISTILNSQGITYYKIEFELDKSKDKFTDIKCANIVVNQHYSNLEKVLDKRLDIKINVYVDEDIVI